jgi:hypothetical protein
MAGPHLDWRKLLPTNFMHQYLVSLQHTQNKGAIEASPAGAAGWRSGTWCPLSALCSEDIEARSRSWVSKSTKVNQKWDPNRGFWRLCTLETGLKATGSEQNQLRLSSESIHSDKNPVRLVAAPPFFPAQTWPSVSCVASTNFSFSDILQGRSVPQMWGEVRSKLLYGDRSTERNPSSNRTLF